MRCWIDRFCLLVAIAFVAAVFGSCSSMPHRPAPPSACTRTLPLLVAFDDESFSFAAEFVAAAQPWTDALGRPALRLARENEIPDYVVLTAGARPKDHPTWLASTSAHCDSAGVWVTETTYYDHGDAAADYRVAMHEIGHALGVDHSAIETSIMYPNVDDKPGQNVLDSDAAVVRRANPR